MVEDFSTQFSPLYLRMSSVPILKQPVYSFQSVIVKGMLNRQPNLNDVDNTDISNSKLKMK